MPRNLFKSARRDIRNVRRALNADTMGDYKASGSQLDAIYANLRTTGAGAGAALTSRQNREMAAMDRIRSRNVAAGDRVVKKTAAQERTRYGTALGGTVDESLGLARATASATKVGTLGQRKAATILSEAGQLAMKTGEQGAAEAQAAADYAHEVALKSRFQTDAATVAQMQFDLKQLRINHQFAMEEMKTQAALQWKYRELELNKLQNAEQSDPASYTGLTQAAGSAAGAYTGLQKIFETAGTDGSFPTANDAAEAYISQHGIQDPAEISFIKSISSAMYANGAGPTNPGGLNNTENGLYGAGTSPELRQQMVIDSIMETIMAQYPQYRDKESELRTYLEATGTANFTLQAAGLLDTATGGTTNYSGVQGYVQDVLEIAKFVPPFNNA